MSGRYDATPSRITRTRSGSPVLLGVLARSWRTNSVVNALLLQSAGCLLGVCIPIVPHRGSGRVAAVRSPPEVRLPTPFRRVPRRLKSHPVTSATVLIGWRAVPRAHVGDTPRRGALALGCIAAALIGIVGCTTVTNGTATPDTKIAPAYRQSVSASVSASSATSSIRESQRQQSVTTRAVRTSCDSLATTSKDAFDKVNAFVGAFNVG